MRSRPEIEITLPKLTHPGDDVRVTVVVRSGSATPVDRIEVSLTGVEEAWYPEQSNRRSRRTFHTTSALLRGEGALEEGTYTLEASLELPAEMPCSYIGNAAEVRYSIKVCAEIPWWPDAHESAELVVTPRRAPRPAALPSSTSSERGDSPFLEMAIDDRSFAPGDVITGAVAVGNVRGADLGGMDISLVGGERVRLPGWRERERVLEAYRHTVFLSVDSAKEGREMDFRIPIPKDAAPSFDEGLFALEWGVEARLDLGIARSVTAWIPVVLGPYPRAKADSSADVEPSRGERRSPRAAKKRPKIGSDRWRSVWSSAGSKSGLSLDEDDLRLTGLLHGYEASIAPDEGGDASGVILAELAWPSLGIGLKIGKAGLALFAPDNEIESRYRIKSREAAQAEAFLTAPLKKALLAFESIELDDTSARLKARGPAHDAPWIAGFLELVAAVASEVSASAPQIPPPTKMASMLGAWQAFADELGGRLEVGSMCVRDGRLDGGAFTIETRFLAEPRGGSEAMPSRTIVALSPDPRLPEALDVESEEALASVPAAVRSLVASIRERASKLRVSEELVEIDLPAPLADPSSLRELLRAMLALAERLSGDHRGGPYR